MTRDPNEHGTPTWLINLAREVMGHIDLDPFSSAWHNARVRADRFMDGTPGHDGLAGAEWYGASTEMARIWCHNRVWCNPPYSGKGVLKKCVDRWILAAEEGEMSASCLLVNTDTSTALFHTLAQYPHCLLAKRVSFHHPDVSEHMVCDGNRYGQMVVYVGTRYPSFRKVFSEVGIVR